MSTELRTERLLLRRPRPADLDAMFVLMSNPAAMRFWSTLPHADREVTAKWLAQMLARTADGGEDFVIEQEGKAIGFVGAGRLPEFGFMLHQDYWGRGIAVEASRAFIAYAFGELGVPELTADVDPRNAPSLKVLERLGFSVTGTAERTFLLGEEWCDSVYLRLGREG
ncbi:MAG: N-acetyltransferase [Hyphomicrobiales bacterium]|nr:MAG: N-acetyltransferase [Hyphomicrobiales bacterium]